MRYQYSEFPYETPPELAGRPGFDAPVAIVGAGPIGLACAIDLALHGIKSVVLDDNNVVSVGSRAICWAKRTLEVFDRLGVGERMLEKGVTWKVGRLFHGDQEVYSFDLLPEEGHKYPAFINLQQYYVEEYLVDRCRDFPELIDLRFLNKVTDFALGGDGVRLTVETPDGEYLLPAAYMLACDGAKSPMRDLMGLQFEGRVFEERFLIADIEMTADFPSERWFWFEPSFHPGQSALLHKQPDNIYRIDLQLGWDTDPEHEKQPEVVIPRIEKVVQGRPFELDWVSVYTFQCRRLERFIHDRVIFVGDSAHVVSPFGARGGNGGIQDVDNLCWKLAAVLKGAAGPGLLDSYNDERVHGADENILNSTRATRFMSPNAGAERLFRDEALALAGAHGFARRLINSGRLSVPCSLAGFPLQTPPDAALPGEMVPGMVCLDAPLTALDGRQTWLLDQLRGEFLLLAVGCAAPRLPDIASLTIGPGGDFADAAGFLARRYGEGLFLIRPDQHLAALWPAASGTPTAEAISAARDRAMGFGSDRTILAGAAE